MVHVDGPIYHKMGNIMGNYNNNDTNNNSYKNTPVWLGK